MYPSLGRRCDENQASCAPHLPSGEGRSIHCATRREETPYFPAPACASVRHDEMSAIPHEIPARLLDDPCRSIADCNQPGDELDLHAAARRVSMPLQCRCNSLPPLGSYRSWTSVDQSVFFILHWSVPLRPRGKDSGCSSGALGACTMTPVQFRHCTSYHRRVPK